MLLIIILNWIKWPLSPLFKQSDVKILSGHSRKMFSKRWDARDGGGLERQEDMLQKPVSSKRTSVHSALLRRSDGSKVPRGSDFLLLLNSGTGRCYHMFQPSASFSETLVSKRPLKPKTRPSPLVTAGDSRAAPPAPNTKTDRRAACEAGALQSNLKTLSHNYGKFFTFMLYWK